MTAGTYFGFFIDTLIDNIESSYHALGLYFILPCLCLQFARNKKQLMVLIVMGWAISGAATYAMMQYHSYDLAKAAKETGHLMCGMGLLYIMYNGIVVLSGIAVGGAVRAVTLFLAGKKCNKAVIVAAMLACMLVGICLTVVMVAKEDFSFARYEKKREEFLRRQGELTVKYNRDSSSCGKDRADQKNIEYITIKDLPRFSDYPAEKTGQMLFDGRKRANFNGFYRVIWRGVPHCTGCGFHEVVNLETGKVVGKVKDYQAMFPPVFDLSSRLIIENEPPSWYDLCASSKNPPVVFYEIKNDELVKVREVELLDLEALKENSEVARRKMPDAVKFFEVEDKSHVDLPGDVQAVLEKELSAHGKICAFAGQVIDLGSDTQERYYAVAGRDGCGAGSSSAPVWIVRQTADKTQVVLAGSAMRVAALPERHNGLRDLRLTGGNAGSAFVEYWRYNNGSYKEAIRKNFSADCKDLSGDPDNPFECNKIENQASGPRNGNANDQ